MYLLSPLSGNPPNTSRSLTAQELKPNSHFLRIPSKWESMADSMMLNRQDRGFPRGSLASPIAECCPPELGFPRGAISSLGPPTLSKQTQGGAVPEVPSGTEAAMEVRTLL